MDRAATGKALGKVVSGVFILTAGKGQDATAMLVSWVQQIGFDPPMVSVAIAKERILGTAIRESRGFALSILAERDTGLMKHYVRGKEEPFKGVNVKQTAGGYPVLRDALAFVECELISIVETGGDHDLYLGKIVDGEMLKEGKPFVHVRGNGMRY